MKKNLSCILVLCLAACSQGQRETFAHITQRQLDNSGKVMITYQFRAGDGVVKDSMEVQKSIVVPHDSVKVVYEAADPSKSHLVLP